MGLFGKGNKDQKRHGKGKKGGQFAKDTRGKNAPLSPADARLIQDRLRGILESRRPAQRSPLAAPDGSTEPVNTAYVMYLAHQSDEQPRTEAGKTVNEPADDAPELTEAYKEWEEQSLAMGYVPARVGKQQYDAYLASIKEANAPTVEIRTPRCACCGEEGSVVISEDDYAAADYAGLRGAPWAEHFPNLPVPYQEQMKSGIHPDCFDSVSGRPFW